MKRKHLKIKAIQHFSIMVCQLTLEKWEYHQCLIELQLYPAESFTGAKVLIVLRKMAESFLHRAARERQPIEAGAAQPQGDGVGGQKEVCPRVIDGN